MRGTRVIESNPPAARATIKTSSTSLAATGIVRGLGDERGFTLVELIIAMVVTGIIVAMIMVTFTAQNQLYRRQHDIGRTQQNLRLAMEIVTKDVALAGFGSGADGAFYGALGNPGDGQSLPTVLAYDAWNGGRPDAITISYMDPNREHWGFVDRSEAGSGQADRFMCTTTVFYFSANSAAAAGNFDDGDEQWDQIVCFANAGNNGLGVGYVWDVSGSGDGGTGEVGVNINSGHADYAALCPNARSLPEEMVCSRLVQVSYFIDQTSGDSDPGTEDTPYLMLSFDEDFSDSDNVPIAPGIENVQFNYCELLDDCDGHHWAGEQTPPPDFSHLSRVRVRMAARSERRAEDNAPATIPVRLDQDNSDYTTQDAFHRRVAHQVVVIRNARAAKEIEDVY